MTENKTSFIDSAMDALKPTNIALKFLQFIVFGVITATPYLISNLDKVFVNVISTSNPGILHVILGYLKALMGSIWIGVGLGLSTLFSTLLDIFTKQTILKEVMIGTMIFSCIVLIFATLTFFQPVQILFNILDMKKERQHSTSLIGLVSLLIVIIIASPMSYAIMDGQTITSSLREDSSDKIQEVNETAEDITYSNESNTITNSLDMLNVGG